MGIARQSGGRVLNVVLSRKGFDSASGGIPSPILPGGKLVPLPIPAAGDRHTFDEVAINQVSLGTLVEDLTGGKIKENRMAVCRTLE